MRMRHAVYRGDDDVVHWREYRPRTCCGIHIETEPGWFRDYRTIRQTGYGGDVDVLPMVTCALCLAEAYDEVRDGSPSQSLEGWYAKLEFMDSG